MQFVRVLVVVSFAAFLNACSVLSVHKGGKVDGVPFFVRSAQCRHELTWIEPVYTLTLQSVSVKDGKETTTPIGVAEFSRSDYGSVQTKSDIASLKRAIVNGQDPLTMWTSIQTTHVYNPLNADTPTSADLVLVSNTSKAETIVDYRDTYYFNTHRPIIGSAKSDIKLAPDGTMTEGSGELESKTLQSFLDLLPIKELISKAGGLAAAGGGVGQGTSYRLQIESRAITHTHYRYYPMSSNSAEAACPARAAVSFDDVTYNRDRSEQAKDKSTDKDKKNSVKVSGEIQLPSNDEKKKEQ